MMSLGRGGGEVLKFVTCLHIVWFLNSRFIVYFCGWGYMGRWVGGWFVEVIIVLSLLLKLALIKKQLFWLWCQC